MQASHAMPPGAIDLAAGKYGFDAVWDLKSWLFRPIT
jgi:hypothetical protein